MTNTSRLTNAVSRSHSRETMAEGECSHLSTYTVVHRHQMLMMRGMKETQYN